MTSIKRFFLFYVFFVVVSCNSDDDCGSPAWTTPTNLEVEYGCTNTKYQMDIDLNDDFVIIRSQQDFNNLVTGTCSPDIDFSAYDLVIGKKALTSGNTSIEYSYMKHPCSNAKYLEVHFIQNATAEAPNLTYHALVPKLNANETVNVTIELLQ